MVLLRWGLRTDATGMAIGAIHCGQVAEIDRMLEGHSFGRDHRLFSVRLAEHGVTSIAVLREHLAIRAHMLAIMATEAPCEIEVTDVIVVSFPIQLHFRKRGAPVNALQLGDSIADLPLL